MIRKYYKFIFLSILIITLIGCATIVHGGRQKIPVKSTPSGATVTINKIRVNTPGVIKLSRFEPTAVLRFEKEGYEVTYVRVNKEGLANPKDVRDAIRPDTVLVSVMYANNEIGTIQPIHEIGQIIKDIRKKRRESGDPNPIWFHTDACQASAYLNLDVQKLGVDLMTINGSKIYGPKGIGLLFVRRGVKLEALYEGGGQENKLRSGTEHIAGIVGLGEALKLVQEHKEQENRRLTELRDYFIKGLFERVPKIVLNGHPVKRLPNNVNISILDIEGEAMLLYLDKYGIEASTGSACDSATLDPSHVILALGKPYEFAHASMRFTMGHSTTREDLDIALKTLPGIVEILRKISPVHLDLDATQMSTAAAFAGEGFPHWEAKRGSKLKLRSKQ